MWGPYECFSSAELGDTEFCVLFSYRRTEALMRETTSGYRRKPPNNGLFWSSVNAKILVSGIANACELG